MHPVNTTHSAAGERGGSRQADANDDANRKRLFMTLLLICSLKLRNLGDAEVRRGSGGNLDALRDLFGSIERASFQAGRCISR